MSEKVSVSEKATFAAGCFWGVEARFRKILGVLDVESGYTGGHTKNPTYNEVCGGKTGHAEAVQITFDPKVVTYEQLLDVFWHMHDPTTWHRQGPDVGEQYRSAIFTHTPHQAEAARQSLAALEKSGRYKKPIVTQISQAGPFYRAEEYHQQYHSKHGGSCNL